MQKYANLVELEKCCQTHILNYFLAKFHFDTAENEPAKNLHFFAKKHQKTLIVLGLLILLMRTIWQRFGVARAGVEERDRSHESNNRHSRDEVLRF